MAPVLEQHSMEHIEKMIPLVSSIAAFGDYEFGDLNISTKMDRVARNVKSAEVITGHVRKTLEMAGVLQPANFSLLKDLNEMVTNLREDYVWIAETLAINGSTFMQKDAYTRVLKFKSEVKVASLRVRSLDLPAIRNNQIVTECNTILNKSIDYLNQIEQIRKSAGFRPTPVGICFKGASQCGKSTIIPILLEKVKVKLMAHSALLGDTRHWSRWDANQREDFDTGYCGQEMVYMDDAFQDKSNKDHLMWYTYISSVCVGTIQGVAEQKGLPFNGLICAVTTNSYPRTSITVNNIDALHERWPITVDFEYKEGIKSPPKVWDPEFSYLDFRVGKMTEAVRMNHRNELESVTLDGIVDRIVQKVVDEHEFYNCKQATMRTIIVEEHMENESSDAYNDADFLNFLERVERRTFPYYEDGLEAIVEENEDENLVGQRMAVSHQGTSNSLINWDRVAVNIIKDIQGALALQIPSQITEVGEWTKFLKRRNVGGTQNFSVELYDGEYPLYNFISALGCWVVPDEDMEAFNELWVRQHLLLVESPLGDLYLWGPTLSQGLALYLISSEMRNQVETILLPIYIRKPKLWAKQIVDQLSRPDRRRLIFRMALPIIGGSFLPSTLTVLAQWRVMSTWQLQRPIVPLWRHVNHRWWHPRTVLTHYGDAMNFPMGMVVRGFNYLDQTLLRLRTGLKGILLQCLEFLGVDVSGYWQEIADLTSHAISDTISIAIASALIYLVYRIVKFMLEPPKLIERSKDDEGKGGYKQRGTRAEQRKQMRVRTLQQRCVPDEVFCKEDCKREEFYTDDNQWLKLESCSDLDGIYTGDWLVDLMETEQDLISFEIVRRDKTHIACRAVPLEDDFLIQKNQFLGAYRNAMDDGLTTKFVMTINFELVGSESEVRTAYSSYMEKFRSKQIKDWDANFSMKRFESDNAEVYHIKIGLVCLNTNIQGKQKNFIKNELKDLRDISEELKGIKIKDDKTVEDILTQMGKDEALDLMKTLVRNHQVWVSYVPLHDMDSDLKGRHTHGIGHLDSIITNAHLFSVGEILRFKRYEDKDSPVYQVCRVTFVDPIRDIARALILSKTELKQHAVKEGYLKDFLKVSTMKDHFRSISPHLCDEKNWRDLVSGQTCLYWLPTSGGMAVGRVNPAHAKVYPLASVAGERVTREYLEITELRVNLELARPGDCGGLVLSYHDRYQTKIVGFHAGGTNRLWVASMLRKEDLEHLEQHGFEDDNWRKLIVEGEPTDLPKGGECRFLGKYRSSTKPVSEKSISHWKYTPWAEEFEEQLQPSALNAYDKRIEEEVMMNMNGVRSLLLKPNSIMCSKLPDLDSELLKKIVSQMTTEMTMKIGHIASCKEDVDELIYIGLNGERENLYCKSMDLNKSSGLPWNDIKECSKKSDFLDNTMGYVQFRPNEKGDLLWRRTKGKLIRAKQGDRSISLCVSKLKDELVKISAVKEGKTRVFVCIPVEKVICDAALFGNFKEAYCQGFLDLNHAVGINPHSLNWSNLYDHLSKHPNVFDLDFKNYDKHFHGELMKASFQIIRDVIQNKAPDGWDLARKVMMDESVNTYCVDYDTVYETKQGNKSGEYLTTVLNCIANDILSFYTWIKVTQNEDISEFRKNVSLVTFGDDKCESVSDEYAEVYNYFSAKEEMTKIGHTITPGNKDGIEKKFCLMSELQFLKRTFVLDNGKVLAPLLTRSIESPFVWTQISVTEQQIWQNLVEQSLYEAVLHGPDYFESFRQKLMKCDDADLLLALSSLLSVEFEEVKKRYMRVYYGTKTHINHE